MVDRRESFVARMVPGTPAGERIAKEALELLLQPALIDLRSTHHDQLAVLPVGVFHAWKRTASLKTSLNEIHMLVGDLVTEADQHVVAILIPLDADLTEVSIVFVKGWPPRCRSALRRCSEPADSEEPFIGGLHSVWAKPPSVHFEDARPEGSDVAEMDGVIHWCRNFDHRFHEAGSLFDKLGRYLDQDAGVVRWRDGDGRDRRTRFAPGDYGPKRLLRVACKQRA